MQGGQLIARGAGIAILVFAAFAALEQQSAAPGGYEYDTTSIRPGPEGASGAGGLDEVQAAGRRVRRER